MMRKIKCEDVQNRRLREEIEYYMGIYEMFRKDVADYGMAISGNDGDSEYADNLKSILGTMGVKSRNDCKSYVWGNLSPSCLHCRTGAGSETFILSLKCNRDCYFCTNKNQLDYESGKDSVNDIVERYDRMTSACGTLLSAGITGGEPLLFPEKCAEFIRHVKSRDSRTLVRIYTNGDLADKDTLMRLADAGLDEIRFGLKFNDDDIVPENLYQNLETAVGIIPGTVVEVPVKPGGFEAMKTLLDRSEAMGVYSVNLLEFLFPWVNPEEYVKSGYRVKKTPYRILHNYTYAGGLPIEGSEEECLRLVLYAAENRFKTGVHYCSLENKLTSQVWQQNSGIKLTPVEYFSQKDFFIKTAKAYGDEAKTAKMVLDRNGCRHYTCYDDVGVLEFPVTDIRLLKGHDMELGISSMVCDQHGGKRCIKEVAVDYTDPAQFSIDDI